jgi:hypothetical protein
VLAGEEEGADGNREGGTQPEDDEGQWDDPIALAGVGDAQGAAGEQDRPRHPEEGEERQVADERTGEALHCPSLADVGP